jgi:hypothetical protein
VSRGAGCSRRSRGFTDRPTGSTVAVLANAAVRGAVAGAVGVAVMTVGEGLEQRLTGRPESYVPGRTLLALVGRRPAEADRPVAVNHAMHWGTGVALGALRGVWAVSGLRGLRWSLAHTGVRLATDQTLENATRVGAPPQTWPTMERRVDTLHKLVYSVVAGWVADRLITPAPINPAGRFSH